MVLLFRIFSPSAQPPQHLFGVVRIFQGCLPADPAAAIQLQNGPIHAEHPLFPSRGDGTGNLMVLAVPDHTAYGACHVHDLKCGHSVTVHTGQQLLGYDGVQHHTELNTNLLLLIGRKRVDHAVNGIHRTLGQGGTLGSRRRQPRRRWAG